MKNNKKYVLTFRLANMPLRYLLYVGRVYEKMIPVKDRYRQKTVKIPRPEFFVFYNGRAKTPNEYTQKLFSAYIDNKDTGDVSLELTVKVININTDAGNEILSKCKILNEYSQFVEQVRIFVYCGNGLSEMSGNLLPFYCIGNSIGFPIQ